MGLYTSTPFGGMMPGQTPVSNCWASLGKAVGLMMIFKTFLCGSGGAAGEGHAICGVDSSGGWGKLSNWQVI